MQKGVNTLFIVMLLLAFSRLNGQQLRLGDTPYSMEKSAVLDLNATSQGLLLPRIADTALINALSPPDGMIIYFVPQKKLLLRSNGSWKFFAQEGSGVLSVNGNTGAVTIDTTYISNFSAKVRSLFGATGPLIYNNGNFSIQQANTSANGFLSSADWDNFNNKLGPGRTINTTSPLTGGGDLSSDRTISISTNGIANTHLRQSAAYSIIGRSTGSVGNVADIVAANDGEVLRRSGTDLSFGTISTTGIDNGAVSYAKIQNLAGNNRLLGRASTGAGIIEEIILGSGLSFSGTTLNVGNISNSALANNTIGLTLGTSGTDVNTSGSPAVLGGAITLNLPTASATNRGLMSATDWSAFNNKQAAGNYMTDPGANGILVRTALNTSTSRTVTGSVNRISITNGDGASGNPTIDISSNYVGQTSIATLGTITAGTWNGTIIQSAYGGTGNGFTKFTGPATSEKTFTLPNANATILTSAAAVTIAQGGTGQTTATAGLNALLPTQTGNSGLYLTTDGTNASWADPSPGNDNYVFSYNTAQVSVTANSWVNIPFTTDPQISGWTHSISTNNQNFTCQQTGLYMICYTAQASSSNTAAYEIGIKAMLDATEVLGSLSTVFATSTNGPVLSNQFMVNITSGQVLKLQLNGTNNVLRLLGSSNATFNTSTRPSITLTIRRIK